ncbi:CBS domain-containing protein, partial [Vibrio alginolyticus]|uniref:CBS domain-containing protein n=1 Tax=Vibrio alginolyticus TaxID=663 RepID=UPI001A8F9EB2
PVMDEDGRLLGFIDVRDILTSLLLSVSKGYNEETLQWAQFETGVAQLSGRGDAFFHRPIGDILSSLVFPHPSLRSDRASCVVPRGTW